MSDDLTFDFLVGSIRQIHEQLSSQAGRAVNISLTLRNWLIGAYISEYELRGADRATYGDSLLTELAKRLTDLRISNSNRRQLYRYLRFYRLYPEMWGHCPHNYRSSCPAACSAVRRRATQLKKWGQRPHNCESLRINSSIGFHTATWN